MTPQKIKHYDIKKVLAQGSDSIIYEAWDTLENQECILKQLFIHQLDAWKRLDLFKREAETLAYLKHPQIPQLWDYFIEESEDKKSIFLVMEKVPGIPLLNRVLDGWTLDEEECHKIAFQLLMILVYLHSKHPPVVHRDIKPSNLLLDEEGTLYLIDFGGVQETLKYEGSGGSTIVGTFGYMAPEQFTGRSLPQTDLYGVGATLIFLLSGREPANMPQNKMMIQFRSYIDCSAVFANWIEHLIAPSLKERFQSAEQSLGVLQDILPKYSHHFTPPKIQTLSTKRKLTAPKISQVQINPIKQAQAHGFGLVPGQLLKETYVIQEILGKGSVSMTYSGEVKTSGKKIIIKELHFEKIDNWKSFELFEREIKTLSQLNHPNIPKLIETFHLTLKNTCYYIVTERIPGLNLLEKIQDNWRPSEAQVLDLAHQALPILMQLHQQKPRVIHRDIKPSNLILTPQDQLFLIDFGAVQDLTQIKGGGGSTVIGTYGYMAPEQFTGNATPLSDLYSLGATLVHCLSNIPPSEMKHEDLKLQFRPVVNCSENFAWWIETLLEPMPEKRFQSAEKALDALQRLGSMTRTTQNQQTKELTLPEFDPTDSDKAIEVYEKADEISFKIRPNMHDFKRYIVALSFIDLFLFPFLMNIPELGPAVILFLLLLQIGLLLKIMNDGEKKTLFIKLTPEMATIEAHNNYFKLDEETPYDRLETPISSLKRFKIDQKEIHNRLIIFIQHSSNSYPVQYKTKLSLAPNKKQAEYILMRMQLFLQRFQNTHL